MSCINIIKTTFLICISSIISFLIVEYSYRQIKYADIKTDYPNPTMLFEASDNFKNHDGFFKYFPNKEIRSTTLYSKTTPKSIDDLVIAYDYLIHTNNVGLVMQKDLFPQERVIFVIGDSFTEGQGAPPWFYDLEKSYDIANIKIVNLGIIGTGPQQWENLASSIKKELRLDVIATIVNIIPDDIRREVWTFKDRELDCLHRASCDYVLRFQGYKFAAKESYDDIKQSVLRTLVETDTIVKSDYLSKIKNIIKKSRVIFDLYHYFRLTISVQPKINEASLLALNRAASGNFYVNVVSEKGVNSTNFMDSKNAMQLIEFLQKHKIRYQWCDIPADGYHKYDFHPNVNGYKILRKCTKDALDKLNFASQ